MGTTFCNLFWHSGQRELLETLIGEGDRLETGINGWSMVLSEDRNPQSLARLASRLAGDSLIFFYFDDDLFELTLIRDGKMAASLSSDGKGKKLPVLAELLPEDPSAARKFKALGDCVTMDEKLSLLEETFGLPFYALLEQEKVTAAKKSERTWETMKARKNALKKRQNRFRAEPLAEADWPASSRIRKHLIDRLRGKASIFSLFDLLHDVAEQRLSQPGQPCRILLPMYICREDEESYQGYNYVLVTDGHEASAYAFPFSIHQPLMVNDGGFLICESLGLNSVACYDTQGNAQWTFAPEMAHPQQLHFVQTTPGELVFRCAHGKKTPSRLWRLSPEDGRILNERALPEGQNPHDLRWLEEMGCFAYYQIESNSLMLLNRDFSDQKLIPLGEKRLRFDVSFYSGHCGYLNDGDAALIELDLLTGNMRKIQLETPAYVNRMFPGGVFSGGSEERGNVHYLFDREGRVLLRQSFKGALLGLWEENGRIYAATFKPGRIPGFIEEPMLDTLSVYQLVDQHPSG
ncbi:MAG: hypothetical protein IKP40_08630 [Clostridia bacterium]|nr:hypothetical protein [Clostridia bacterium]